MFCILGFELSNDLDLHILYSRKSKPEGCLWCRYIVYWRRPTDKLLSGSERTSWTKTTLREETAWINKSQGNVTKIQIWNREQKKRAFAYLVWPVQSCAGQRLNSMSVSAPRMWFCTASPDTRTWCALPGNENCCGRVSLTSKGQRDQPVRKT